MGKVVLNLVSKQGDTCYLQATASSPSFSAVTTFNCQGKSLVEFGKLIKGYPHENDERAEYSLGAGKGRADFAFKTVGDSGLCELWIRFKGLEDEQGQSPEAYFPIDYLEPSSIGTFSMELIRIGTGNGKTAELKNRFEKS